MSLVMRKDPEAGVGWMRIPECDECESTTYYAADALWTFIAEDSGWRIDARSGAATCPKCLAAKPGGAQR